MVITLVSANSYAIDPGSVKAGIFEITSQLSLDTKFDDNIFKSPDEEEDDVIFLINPNIEAVAKDRNNEYTIKLDLVEGIYNDNDSGPNNQGDDDFTDWQVDADAHVEINSRNMIDLYGGFHSLHEDRGSGFSEGALVFTIEEPDEYEETLAGGAYTFGGEQSKGRLKLAGDYLDKDYTNHEPDTDTRDRENTSGTGTFFWNIAPKTDILAEVRYLEIEYQTQFTDGTPQLDSDETYYRVGISWEATGKTTGTVKLGVVDKDFDDNARDDFEDEFTWDADVYWQPREHHAFNFGAAQIAQETTGTGDFINTEEYTASWIWEFNQRTDFYTSLRYAKDEYEGTSREDDLIYAELGVTYDIRRWLGVRLSYTYDERDSDNEDADLDYEKNIFLIGIDLSL